MPLLCVRINRDWDIHNSFNGTRLQRGGLGAGGGITGASGAV